MMPFVGRRFWSTEIQKVVDVELTSEFESLIRVSCHRQDENNDCPKAESRLRLEHNSLTEVSMSRSNFID